MGQYSWSNSQCIDCQKFPDEDRQRVWADELLPNQKTTSGFSPFSLFQPYIDLRPIYLGQGFNISAMLSQRWRDGMEDIPGIIYERNITLEHEYYGKIQIGAFPSRGWAVADYPYGRASDLRMLGDQVGQVMACSEMPSDTVPLFKTTFEVNFVGKSPTTSETVATNQVKIL